MSEEETVYELSDETMKLLKKRRTRRDGSGCFLCTMILRDFEEHKKLTGYPKDVNGAEVFPIEGKLKHIELERADPPSGKEEDPKV
ncbi:MAG: hypothetical protein ACRD1Z_20005 [Vicinamibacteria bacterium]